MSYITSDPELHEISKVRQEEARQKRLEEAAADFEMLKEKVLSGGVRLTHESVDLLVVELLKVAEMKKIEKAISALDFNL